MALTADKPFAVFRVDASSRIGTGHLMRCLTLANELAGGGFDVGFVCRAHLSHMDDEIRKQGHELVLLPLEPGAMSNAPTECEFDYASWLGTTWERDAQHTSSAVAGRRLRWMIVDHYAIDARWERKVKGITGAKVMVIDGLANRMHDCELLLDQTYSSEGGARWDGLVPPSCRRLVGPQFALVRHEFVRAKRTMRARDGQVRRIFIAFGGVDEPNATAVALDALKGVAELGISVDAVIGTANPHRAALLEKYNGRQDLRLQVQPSNLAELMANADLAISAGGTLLLEQCFMELPSVIVSIAPNQVRAAQRLQERGAVVYIGEHSVSQAENTKRLIRQHVLQFLAEPERLIKMQAVCRQLMTKPNEPVSHILLNLANETN